MAKVISQARKAAAKSHAKRKHTCPKCGGMFYGNGYYTHLKACRWISKAEAESKDVS